MEINTVEMIQMWFIKSQYSNKLLPEDTLISIFKLVFQTFGYIDFPITLSHQKVLATKQQILEVTLPL